MEKPVPERLLQMPAPTQVVGHVPKQAKSKLQPAIKNNEKETQKQTLVETPRRKFNKSQNKQVSPFKSTADSLLSTPKAKKLL